MILKHLFTLPILFGALCLHAQREGQFVDNSQQVIFPFTITSFSTRQGLPQSQVVSILTGKNGTLILGTANGIVEYDGYGFTEFITDNRYKNSFPLKLLWSNTTGKLFILNHLRNLHLASPTRQYIGNFQDVCQDNKLIYGIKSDGTITSVDPEKLTPKLLFTLPFHSGKAIVATETHLYVCSSKGLFQSDKDGKHLRKISGETHIDKLVYHPSMRKIIAISSDKVWEVSSSGIKLLFNCGSQKNVRNFITDIAFVTTNDFYVATTNGMYLVTPDYTDYYGVNDLPSRYIVSLFYSPQNDCLFAGTGEKGFLKLQHKNCFSIRIGEPDVLPSLGSICQAGQTVLVAGSSGVIFKVGMDKLTPYWQYPTHFATLSCYENQVIAGSWGDGIFILRNGKLTDRICYPRIPNNFVHSVFRDSRKRYWVGTDKGIATGKSLYTLKPLLPRQIVTSIITFYERRDGSICAGTREGVYILDPDGTLIRHIGRKEGVTGREVRSFYEDQEGKLWFGTYNGGLYCFEHNKLVAINSMPNCELYQDVFTFTKDRFGYFNITSNHGLWKVSEKDLNDFYRGKLDRLVPFYLGQETGILNTEFNGGFQHNYLHTAHDHFYFPTIEGLVVDMPESFPFHRLHPEIKKTWINDTLYNKGSRVFERSTHTIQFDLSCPQFNSKYNLFYQYKLTGNGITPVTWSKLSKQRAISFKMLPPGNYTLYVRAVDAFNDRNPHILKYSFEIKPFFYETIWFKLSLGLLIFMLAIAAGRIRFLQLRNRELHAHTINNTILELKLKAIQAKMNPHFIFNALNNIQYLIVLRELEAAENALTDFSQLLRKFLYQSDKNFVTIEEEFDMLRLYLSIEKFRFNNQLTCTFHTDEELNTFYLPSMLLQPLVENAIKHGLLHSEKERILTITALRHEGNIRISIEDNGIGRHASEIINSSRAEHISHGFKLVTEKINIVREKYNIVVGIQLIDLKEPIKTGTLVLIDLPEIRTLPQE